MAGAWMETNQAFAATMAKQFGGLEPVKTREALKTWLAFADEVLTTNHRSPAYREAQRRLVRAGMDFLLAERELVELLVEPAGLPTRSEIDELHRTVHTLKRKVRALERAEISQGRTRTKPASARARSRAAERTPKEGEG